MGSVLNRVLKAELWRTFRFSSLRDAWLMPFMSSIHKIQKHFQNVMLVGMASEISKNYKYKCADRSRHNGIKGAKAKCAH